MPDRLRSVVDVPWSVVPVADADAVLQDLRHALRTGRPGNIGLLVRTVGLVMSHQTIQEVDAGIDRVAGHPPAVDAQRMHELWASYQDRIETHDPTDADVDCEHGRRLRDRDPKDLPVLAAAASRRNAVILTNDTDLIDLGLAPDSWLTTTRTLLPLVEADATVHGATLAVYFGVAGLGVLGRSAINGSPGARVAIVALAVGLACILADVERRARVAAGVQRAVDAASELAAEKQTHLRQLQPFIVATIVKP